MPKLNGLEFLSAIKTPMGIIISAYHEFAMRSYENNVLDHLLRPIELYRFMVVVQKAASKMNIETSSTEEIGNDGLFFTVNKKKACCLSFNHIYRKPTGKCENRLRIEYFQNPNSH